MSKDARKNLPMPQCSLAGGGHRDTEMFISGQFYVVYLVGNQKWVFFSPGTGDAECRVPMESERQHTILIDDPTAGFSPAANPTSALSAICSALQGLQHLAFDARAKTKLPRYLPNAWTD